MRILFMLFLSAISMFSFSQNNTYMITYRHCFQRDTSKFLTDTIGKEAILIGNNIASNYCLNKIDNNKVDSIQTNAASFADALRKRREGKFSFSIGRPFDAIGDMVYFDKKKDSIFVREKMITDYVLTAEKEPAINWTITSEKKNIKTYECIKAICTFRGRNYSAWYTPAISISEGPWKFKGLPGLILAIEDDKNLVKIYADKIVYPANEIVPAYKPYGIKINLNDYFNYKNNEIANQVKAEEMLMHAQEGHSESDKPPGPKSKNVFFLIELARN